jgi:4-hydroxy-4-methyl-2-oxoglutarate aldolase
VADSDVAQLTERLERIYTGVVYDVMRDAGLPVQTLPPHIRPLLPEGVLAGPVFTMTGAVDDTLDVHQTMLDWTGFLERAAPEHVVVCQPNDSTVAHMGELSAETLQLRGVRGYIVDGGCRDTDFIKGIRFPVWRRYDTPSDIRGRWAPTAFEEPVVIGDATVRPGDFVLADRDGVVVIPREHAVDVVTAAEQAQRQENLVRDAIREGTSPRAAYLTYGKF